MCLRPSQPLGRVLAAHRLRHKPSAAAAILLTPARIAGSWRRLLWFRSARGIASCPTTHQESITQGGCKYIPLTVGLRRAPCIQSKAGNRFFAVLCAAACGPAQPRCGCRQGARLAHIRAALADGPGRRRRRAQRPLEQAQSWLSFKRRRTRRRSALANKTSGGFLGRGCGLYRGHEAPRLTLALGSVQVVGRAPAVAKPS